MGPFFILRPPPQGRSKILKVGMSPFLTTIPIDLQNVLKSPHPPQVCWGDFKGTPTFRNSLNPKSWLDLLDGGALSQQDSVSGVEAL